MSTTALNFTFAEVPSMDTCGNATISWNYGGPSQEISLFVSNGSATPPTSLPLLAFGIAATAGNYTWHPVNITSGLYQILAVGAEVHSASNYFVVTSVNTLSCLSTSQTFPATDTHTPTTTPSALQALPTSDKPSRIGAIVGGVVGGLVFIIALAGACIYVGLRGRAVPGYRWRSFTSVRRAGGPQRWSGLSSHVDISARDPPSSPHSGAAPMFTPEQKDSTPLTALPRLEPNRRKPSCTLSVIPMAVVSNTANNAPQAPPVTYALRLDKALPPRPSSYVASIDRTCGTRTFDTADAVSVIWLRRHSTVSPPTRRPSGASAVPSTTASQMYGVRDSMWSTSLGAPELPDRATPDVWSAHRGARHLVRSKSMLELRGNHELHPLPGGEA